MRTLEKMIKALQQELMVTKELPHVANVRFLAAVDTAERNLIRERQPDAVPVVEDEIINNEENATTVIKENTDAEKN